MILIDAEQLSKHKYVVGCDGAVDMGYISAVNVLAYKLGWNDAIDSVERFALTADIDAITESHEEIGYDKGFRDGYAQASEEVRHGHWIRSSDGYWIECPKCHASIDISMGSGIYNADGDQVEHDWCPHCGAKMDEV